MSVVFILIPLSLVLVGFAAWAFFWAVNTGQFDDLETPGWDMLSDTLATPAVPATTATQTAGIDGAINDVVQSATTDMT